MRFSARVDSNRTFSDENLRLFGSLRLSADRFDRRANVLLGHQRSAAAIAVLRRSSDRSREKLFAGREISLHSKLRGEVFGDERQGN